MDFCNETTFQVHFTAINAQGIELRKTLYKFFCPILIIACIFSVILNSILVIIGYTKTTNKSPILILSLNLATTDCFASMFVGFGLLVNSYLPVVFDMNFTDFHCVLLVIEIFRLASLIASAMHLLSLALVHYKGIVKPLQYRSVIFCSQHRTRSIHFMSIMCWVLPVIFFTIYFSSISCQGFLSANCAKIHFMLTRQFRFIIVILFFIPLIIMLFLYIRIFGLIKNHQDNRSLPGGSVRTFDIKENNSMWFKNKNNKKRFVKKKQDKSSNTFNTIDQDSDHYDISKHDVKCEMLRNGKLKEETKTSLKEDNNQSQAEQQEQDENNSQIYTNTKSLIISETKRLFNPEDDQTDCIHHVENTGNHDIEARHNSNMTIHNFDPENNGNAKNEFEDQHVDVENCQQTKEIQLNHKASFQSHDVISNGNCHGNLMKEKDLINTKTNNLSIILKGASTSASATKKINSLQRSTRPQVQGHKKALITTLLILGTYLLCWMPAVIFFALTCIDGCLYPLLQLSFTKRIIIGFITNGLVIVKAIVDPFIYTYRMKEMKSALKKRNWILKASPFSAYRHYQFNNRSSTSQRSGTLITMRSSTSPSSLRHRGLFAETSLIIKNKS